MNLYDLRNSIGIVPQDAFLFSDTIKNNIKFGKEDATDEEVMEAAKKAVVHNNIMSFNLQYETLLGERGITLSGGQKQRVSIARAIIKNQPSIQQSKKMEVSWLGNRSEERRVGKEC